MVESEQTRKIVWNGKLPLDNSEIDNIKEVNKSLAWQNNKLTTEIQKMQREINIIQFESDKPDIYRRKEKPIIEKRPVLRPSLIFEQNINCGYRVTVTNSRVIVTVQGKDKMFGVKAFDHATFNEPHYIPIHTQQIRELQPSILDSMVIATVSNDCQLMQTSLRTEQIISKVILPTPLWSCDWLKPNCVAAGGTNGKFFVVDGRGEVAFNGQVENGPPVTSVIRVDDNFCYFVTPKKGILFDIRAMGMTKNYISGFNTGCACVGYPKLVTSISRKGNTGSFLLQKFTKNGNMSSVSAHQIPEYATLARASACAVGESAFIVVPDGKSFSLFTATLKDNKIGGNLWEKWKNRFPDREASSILDVSIGKGNDLLVATVTDKKLRVFAIP